MVEGENPVVAGESEEVAGGGRDGIEGRGAGVDDGTKEAGGEGFAGAWGTLEDEDGEGAIGVEGGEEPGEAAEPVGAGGEVETGAEGIERVGGCRRGGGSGKGESGSGGLEESVGAGGGLPAGGRDFDELALGIGEVEEDLGGDGAVAAASDATEDGEALVLFALAGLGFEEIEDGMEGAGGGDGGVLGVEPMEEPLAVGAGADGEDVETTG